MNKTRFGGFFLASIWNDLWLYVYAFLSLLVSHEYAISPAWAVDFQRKPSLSRPSNSVIQP